MLEPVVKHWARLPSAFWLRGGTVSHCPVSFCAYVFTRFGADVAVGVGVGVGRRASAGFCFAFVSGFGFGFGFGAGIDLRSLPGCSSLPSFGVFSPPVCVSLACIEASSPPAAVFAFCFSR
jgi:hypothetical protein